MIKIDSLDHYGRGIAKLNGKIVFVENALPLEVVDIKVLKDKKNYIEASVLKYIEKSKERVDVVCPYYDECGGCNIMHMDYTNQLKFKEDKIKNIVSKYLDNDIKINNIVKCDKNFNYRNKVTFQVKRDIGFFKNDTYDIVCVDKCVISDKIINNSIKHLKELDLKHINKITCRVGNGKLMVIIESSDSDIDIKPILNIASSIYLNFNNTYKHLYGDKYIYEDIGKYRFAISPDSFFQVNINTTTKLYNKIKEYVESSKNVLDLYCGTGTIGIFVSENNNILGIEINESAVKDALYNKRLNKLSNIDFICGDSKNACLKTKFKPDIVIVDPPRSGLNNEGINNIIKLNPSEIIYVSCDPMTMVRDLKELKKYYNIEEITPFDMFPNTYHVECLTYLKRV